MYYLYIYYLFLDYQDKRNITQIGDLCKIKNHVLYSSWLCLYLLIHTGLYCVKSLSGYRQPIMTYFIFNFFKLFTNFLFFLLKLASAFLCFFYFFFCHNNGMVFFGFDTSSLLHLLKV